MITVFKGAHVRLTKQKIAHWSILGVSGVLVTPSTEHMHAAECTRLMVGGDGFFSFCRFGLFSAAFMMVSVSYLFHVYIFFDVVHLLSMVRFFSVCFGTHCCLFTFSYVTVEVFV